jgi:CheY-like chemotaxis protein
MKRVARTGLRIVKHSGNTDPVILILHHHSMVRSMFSCLVEWLGYRVEEAVDIDSARVVFNSGAQIVAVVCAYHLADGDTWDFMNGLRARGIDTPFLVVSPRSMNQMEAKGFEFLPLPLRKEVFDRSIRRLVSGQDASVPVRMAGIPRGGRRPLHSGAHLISE